MARIRVFTTQPDLVREHLALPQEAEIVEVSDLQHPPERLRVRFETWPPDPIGFTSDLPSLTDEFRRASPDAEIGFAVAESIINSHELQSAIESAGDSKAKIDIVIGPSD